MSLLPLTGTASVTNADATVTVAGFILTDLNCEPGAAIVLAGMTYFVLSRTNTNTLELTRNYAGSTSGSVSCEISQITADGVDTAIANARLAELLAEMNGSRGQWLRFTFDGATADADPGDGEVRLNNATASNATTIYIDNLDADGATVSGVLDSWDDSTSTSKGQLYLRSTSNPAVFRAYRVTGTVVDGTGYRKLTVTHLGGSGTFVAGDELMVSFAAKGDDVVTGAAIAPASVTATGLVQGGRFRSVTLAGVANGAVGDFGPIGNTVEAVEIHTRNSSGVLVNTDFLVGTSSSPFIQRTGGLSADINTAIGTPTGSSGPAGDINFYAALDHLYVENQSGSSRSFSALIRSGA